MPKNRTTTTVSAAAASAQMDSLLKRVKGERLRVVITQAGEPAAVLLSPTDFDDMLEELDPVFQASLVQAAQDHDAEATVPLDKYLQQRRAATRQRR
jgi:prevent-host-death family protein